MVQGVSEGIIFAERIQSDLLKVSKMHTQAVIYESFFLGLKQGLES